MKKICGTCEGGKKDHWQDMGGNGNCTMMENSGYCAKHPESLAISHGGKYGTMVETDEYFGCAMWTKKTEQPIEGKPQTA